MADWIKSSEDHILLVQETHLGPTEAREVANYMHRQGFQMYGGISHPTDKGTKGGVAVLIKSHIQGRVEHSHLEDGCGFEAVDVRLQRTNLLVVASVYLKTGTSIHTRPNSSILAELLSLEREVDHCGRFQHTSGGACCHERVGRNERVPLQGGGAHH